MTDDRPASAADSDLFRSLCQETHVLLAKVGESVQRLSVQAGSHQIVIEWAPPQMVGRAPLVMPPAVAGTAELESSADGRHAIIAPLVGTFYRCPEPGAKPFVEVGDVVEADQEVGILEAMKIMNRIVADRPGRVAEFAVADGEMVEFEQVIIYLDPVPSSS
jgi:acetyl-CoA carboxylase biotin carboxyl carrier protein